MNVYTSMYPTFIFIIAYMKPKACVWSDCSFLALIDYMYLYTE